MINILIFKLVFIRKSMNFEEWKKNGGHKPPAIISSGILLQGVRDEQINR